MSEIFRNTVEFEVWGDYALFSDPNTRVGGEKTSYHIPTYEALKGILSSVYWKPTLIWIIDKVRVMNPIQTETKGTLRILPSNNEKSERSYYTYLKDCRYQVRAHFVWNFNRPELENDRNEHKHHNVAKRMIDRGGRRDVFLGTRECQGYVKVCTFGEGKGHYDDISQLAFGSMFHGITYPDETYDDKTKKNLTIRFWKPVMKNGVVDFLQPQECPLQRPVLSMEQKVFSEENNNFSSIDNLYKEGF